MITAGDKNLYAFFKTIRLKPTTSPTDTVRNRGMFQRNIKGDNSIIRTSWVSTSKFISYFFTFST